MMDNVGKISLLLLVPFILLYLILSRPTNHTYPPDQSKFTLQTYYVPVNVIHDLNPEGKWVTGRKYRETCKGTHRHGCCGKNRRSLHYVFNDDKPNNYYV